METFASLREYKSIRLTENKDRFIQKNTLLTDEQKAEVLDFFHSHANLEAKVNKGNWNYEIPYEEFKKVMDSVDTEEKRLKKQTKELRKQNGLEGLKEGEDYSIFKETSEYIAYRPLTHKGMRVIASNIVEPKLWCESAIMEWTPKEILPEGEPMKGDLYPGAKWCVAMETDKHWNNYTRQGYTFIVVCSKDLNREEDLKKICLAYKSEELSIGDSVTASDTRLGYVWSDYVETVIRDLEEAWSEHILEDIQKCYCPEEGVYKLSNKIISPKELLKVGKLDHPVVWEGNFILRGPIESLEGCPEKVTGDFDCSDCPKLTTLKGAPREVEGSFYCSERDNLKSLGGAPESVGGDFDCSWCSSLTSLKGAPKYVKGSFWCEHCDSLKSLEGAPEKVGGLFNCKYCSNLMSLKGAPKRVGVDFWCTECSSLTTLEGAPEYVGRIFGCAFCGNLTSLKGAPREVGGSFRCDHCSNLKSLEGAPEYVGREFNCDFCTSLESLKGAPREVGGSFSLYQCTHLLSLEGAPEKVNGNFSCKHCYSLKSLEGAPEYVGGNFDCVLCTGLTTLEGAPKEVGGNMITS